MKDFFVQIGDKLCIDSRDQFNKISDFMTRFDYETLEEARIAAGKDIANYNKKYFQIRKWSDHRKNDNNWVGLKPVDANFEIDVKKEVETVAVKEMQAYTIQTGDSATNRHINHGDDDLIHEMTYYAESEDLSTLQKEAIEFARKHNCKYWNVYSKFSAMPVASNFVEDCRGYKKDIEKKNFNIETGNALRDDFKDVIKANSHFAMKDMELVNDLSLLQEEAQKLAKENGHTYWKVFANGKPVTANFVENLPGYDKNLWKKRYCIEVGTSIKLGTLKKELIVADMVVMNDVYEENIDNLQKHAKELAKKHNSKYWKVYEYKTHKAVASNFIKDLSGYEKEVETMKFEIDVGNDIKDNKFGRFIKYSHENFGKKVVELENDNDVLLKAGMDFAKEKGAKYWGVYTSNNDQPVAANFVENTFGYDKELFVDTKKFAIEVGDSIAESNKNCINSGAINFARQVISLKNDPNVLQEAAKQLAKENGAKYWGVYEVDGVKPIAANFVEGIPGYQKEKTVYALVTGDKTIQKIYIDNSSVCNIEAVSDKDALEKAKEIVKSKNVKCWRLQNNEVEDSNFNGIVIASNYLENHPGYEAPKTNEVSKLHDYTFYSLNAAGKRSLAQTIFAASDEAVLVIANQIAYNHGYKYFDVKSKETGKSIGGNFSQLQEYGVYTGTRLKFENNTPLIFDCEFHTIYSTSLEEAIASIKIEAPNKYFAIYNSDKILYANLKEDKEWKITYFPSGSIDHCLYLKDGKYHNEDGPAVVYYSSNGRDIIREDYFINGVSVSKEEFNQKKKGVKMKEYRLIVGEELIAKNGYYEIDMQPIKGAVTKDGLIKAVSIEAAVAAAESIFKNFPHKRYWQLIDDTEYNQAVDKSKVKPIASSFKDLKMTVPELAAQKLEEKKTEAKLKKQTYEIKYEKPSKVDPDLILQRGLDRFVPGIMINCEENNLKNAINEHFATTDNFFEVYHDGKLINSNYQKGHTFYNHFYDYLYESKITAVQALEKENKALKYELKKKEIEAIQEKQKQVQNRIMEVADKAVRNQITEEMDKEMDKEIQMAQTGIESVVMGRLNEEFNAMKIGGTAVLAEKTVETFQYALVELLGVLYPNEKEDYRAVIETPLGKMMLFRAFAELMSLLPKKIIDNEVVQMFQETCKSKMYETLFNLMFEHAAVFAQQGSNLIAAGLKAMPKLKNDQEFDKMKSRIAVFQENPDDMVESLMDMAQQEAVV